jgi:MFS family permease
VGLAFGTATLSYVVASVLAGPLAAKVGDRKQLLFGGCLIALSYLLIGPAPFLEHASFLQLKTCAPLVLTAMAMTGFGTGLACTRTHPCNRPPCAEACPADALPCLHTALCKQHRRTFDARGRRGDCGNGRQPAAHSAARATLVRMADAPVNTVTLEACRRRGMSVAALTDSLAALTNIAFLSGSLVRQASCAQRRDSSPRRQAAGLPLAFLLTCWPAP